MKYEMNYWSYFVTDGETDRQTDKFFDTIYRLSVKFDTSLTRFACRGIRGNL